MSSLFISFCFAKTVSEPDKYISGTALYCTTNDNAEFREITFKGFIKNSDSLITPFEKNTIVLIVNIIQAVPISFSDSEYVFTLDDLPFSSLLLLFTAPVIADSYFSNNQGGRESFMLSQQLYNGVINHKHVDSRVIVSYSNETNRLKNIPHIIAADIEFTYASNEASSSNFSTNGKAKTQGEFATQLKSIKEKYALITSRKNQKLTLKPSLLSKSTNNDQASVNFVDLVSQIKDTDSTSQFTVIQPSAHSTITQSTISLNITHSNFTSNNTSSVLPSNITQPTFYSDITQSNIRSNIVQPPLYSNLTQPTLRPSITQHSFYSNINFLF
ncbi:8174_t:CDS:2 [Dentiscutata erythropus]|uniref:8174_t:CDS:1 n=1 Tax=Dentiscutata erythropus TaxID=1348616 RepID=A0A9N9NB58_9GLOM|nr:8174_t:CDS:2 [Dentiscutata erythropus]